MSSKEKILASVIGGRSNANINFDDLCRLAAAVGFIARPPKGSHHVFSHPALPEIINLQPRGHQANLIKSSKCET